MDFNNGVVYGIDVVLFLEMFGKTIVLFFEFIIGIMFEFIMGIILEFIIGIIFESIIGMELELLFSIVDFVFEWSDLSIFVEVLEVVGLVDVLVGDG